MMKYFINALFIFIVMLWIGCASTEKLQEGEKTPIVKEETPPPPPDTLIKVDTLDVKIETNQKMASEPRPMPPTAHQPVIKTSSDNFSIQLGAFKEEENSLQFAYTAKNRLNEDIYNIFDKGTGLYRVLVGDFSTKESAKEYRDQLVKKFPEYQDAWVVDVKKEIRK
ncbi:MAG: SPOR domain-containing protein [Bacteroidota bacterium]|nr:SPOR domain-containing protein [Bacteroidota bacterium]